MGDRYDVNAHFVCPRCGEEHDVSDLTRHHSTVGHLQTEKAWFNYRCTPCGSTMAVMMENETDHSSHDGSEHWMLAMLTMVCDREHA